MATKLAFTLTNDDASAPGASVSDVAAVLKGAQEAMRLMVKHLGDYSGKGHSTRRVREQSILRLVGTNAGSLVLKLESPPQVTGQPHLEDFQKAAFDTLLGWNGSESGLPPGVAEPLLDIPRHLSESTRLWIGSDDNPRRAEIKRKQPHGEQSGAEEEALLFGWLREVNWQRRTAQLFDGADRCVKLRFDEVFDDEEMRALATQYVEVRGRGRFNGRGEWTTVAVESITTTRSWRQPFDMQEFLSNPEPRIFDPDSVVTASEPFDVDEFIRAIHQGRDFVKEGSAD